MPWTATTIRRHNKALKGRKASKTAAIANAVLAKTGDEGKALRIANAAAKRIYPRHR